MNTKLSFSRGRCRLCLEDAELQKSHLIPAAVLRSLHSGGKDATSITAERMIQTSRQFQAHLLCRACEERLNKGGETWVLKHMARQHPRTEFPLLDLLGEAVIPGSSNDDGRTWDTTRALKVDTSRLAYFAISMLWRVSIHDWKGVDGYMRRLHLGPYGEPIRQFLLGTGPFPRHCFVRVVLWPERDSVLWGTYIPRRDSERRFYFYSYYLPGITFYMYVGKRVPPELRQTCCISGPLKPIFTSRYMARQTESLLKQLYEYPRTQPVRPGYARIDFLFQFLLQRMQIGLTAKLRGNITKCLIVAFILLS